MEVEPPRTHHNDKITICHCGHAHKCDDNKNNLTGQSHTMITCGGVRALVTPSRIMEVTADTLGDACFHDDAPLVACLIAAGVDVNALDSHGETPLYYAGSNAEIVRMLVAAGAYNLMIAYPSPASIGGGGGGGSERSHRRLLPPATTAAGVGDHR